MNERHLPKGCWCASPGEGRSAPVHAAHRIDRGKVGRFPSALVALVALAMITASSARGSNVSVPDDYPTIQQALASNADTVLIREGDYPERLTIDRSEAGHTVLRAHPANAGPRPRIGALFIVHRQWMSIEGLHVLGGIHLFTYGEMTRLGFESCRLDSGVTHVFAGDTHDLAPLAFTGCVIRGNVSAQVDGAVFTADTLLGGTVSLSTEGGGTFTECIFEGPGSVAIQAGGDNFNLNVARCRIEGYRTGIHIGAGEGRLTAEDNTILNCVDVGILAHSDALIRRNQVRGCGAGIRVSGDVDIEVEENTVLHGSGAGISLSGESAVRVMKNVVGRNAGNGIEVGIRSDYGGVTASGNTVYSNGGDGIALGNCCGGTDEVTANVAYQNMGAGLSLDEGSHDAAVVELSCNDWFGNLAGATRGIAPGAADLAVDPAFCDLARDDAHLSGTSLLLAVPGCGAIGALGRGCDLPRGQRITEVAVTPCDPAGWSGGAGAAIGQTYTKSGSLELRGSGLERVAFTSGNIFGDRLSDLSALEIALLRGDLGIAPADRGPVVRVLVDDGAGARSWLIWEPRRNGIDALPPEKWRTYDLLHARFWQRGIVGSEERTIDLYDRTLADWLAPGTATDDDGDVSIPVGPDARVIGLEIGLEADGSGSIVASADRLRIGFGESQRVFDVDVLRPTHLALAAAPASTCATPLLLSATVTPGDVTGVVDFYEGKHLLGSAELARPGVAKLEIGPLAAGEHRFRAEFRGEPCVAPSAAKEIVHTTRTVLANLEVGSTSPLAFGDSLEFTLYLSPPAASGIVDLWEQGTLLGSTTVAGGRGQIVATVTGIGDHFLIASYRGDGCHAPDSSSFILQTVAGPPIVSVHDEDADELGPGAVSDLAIPVRLSMPSSRTTSVSYALIDGTATAGIDYAPASGVLVFPPGSIEQVVRVRILGDAVPELHETVTVTLSSPVNAILGDSLAVGTIRDDDRARARFAAASGLPAPEGTGGTTTFACAVELATVASHPVTVTYTTADGTAMAGADYVATSGELTFAPGETSKAFEVAVLADTSLERDEQLWLLLGTSHPELAVIENPRIPASIVNDDVMPEARIENATRAEGGLADFEPLRFRVVLSASNEIAAVRISYMTRDVSATSPADYRTVNGTVYFAPGAREDWIEIPMRGDAECEPNETFKVTLFSPMNVMIRGPAAIGTIENDDCTTPTLVSMLVTEATASGIELRWRFEDRAHPPVVSFERSGAPEGPWTQVTLETREADGSTLALDRNVSPGASYWYRLTVRGESGAMEKLGPIAATAAPIADFGLGRVSPNPTRGPASIEFRVARETAVRLAVVDVQGREMAVLAQGPHRPGSYLARWNGEGLHGAAPAGLYFVRFQAAGKTWVTRLAMAR